MMDNQSVWKVTVWDNMAKYWDLECEPSLIGYRATLQFARSAAENYAQSQGGKWERDWHTPDHFNYTRVLIIPGADEPQVVVISPDKVNYDPSS